MEAAVQSAQRRNARSVVVAVPVASSHALNRLGRIANDVKALSVDKNFQAVGQYYAEFSQTSDAEVLALLQTSP